VKVRQSFNLSEKIFEALRRAYAWTLDLSLRGHVLVMLVSFGLIGLTVWQFMVIPKGFLPKEDTGRLLASVEAEQGVGFETMVRRQKALMEIVGQDPDVEAFMSVVGAGGPNSGGNSGRLMITLKAREERAHDADVVLQRLRGKLSQVPGVRVCLQNPPPIRIRGRSSRGQYQFTLQNLNIEELFQGAARLEEALQRLPELQDVNSDLELDNPEVHVAIDRDRASALGVSAYQIEDALATSYGNRSISNIYASNDTYSVIMEVDSAYQRNPEALSMLYVRAAEGGLVPQDSLVTRSLGMGPLSINNSGQLPSATSSFNLAPGVTLGTAVEKVRETALEVLPASITTSFQGEAQAFQDSLQGLWVLLALSILVIYIVLGILYGSFIHPLTILSGLPSAGVGALAILMLFNVDLNIYDFVGVIMLIGIVKKNAIMMIDFALEAQRGKGLPARQAILEGALVRFRPIMMTTVSAIMGTLPIPWGSPWWAACWSRNCLPCISHRCITSIWKACNEWCDGCSASGNQNRNPPR
jgi:hydrophobic/amphiphilic exporter-1 (mainly G- bacteria), HAE1 family